MCRIGPSSSTVGWPKMKEKWSTLEGFWECYHWMYLVMRVTPKPGCHSVTTRMTIIFGRFHVLDLHVSLTSIGGGSHLKLRPIFCSLANHFVLVVSRNHQPHQMGRGWICRGCVIRHLNAIWRSLEDPGAYMLTKNTTNTPSIFSGKTTHNKHLFAMAMPCRVSTPLKQKHWLATNWTWLAQEIGVRYSQIILFGRSLGSGPAVTCRRKLRCDTRDLRAHVRYMYIR